MIIGSIAVLIVFILIPLFLIFSIPPFLDWCLNGTTPDYCWFLHGGSCKAEEPKHGRQERAVKMSEQDSELLRNMTEELRRIDERQKELLKQEFQKPSGRSTQGHSEALISCSLRKPEDLSF